MWGLMYIPDDTTDGILSYSFEAASGKMDSDLGNTVIRVRYAPTDGVPIRGARDGYEPLHHST